MAIPVIVIIAPLIKSVCFLYFICHNTYSEILFLNCFAVLPPPMLFCRVSPSLCSMVSPSSLSHTSLFLRHSHKNMVTRSHIPQYKNVFTYRKTLFNQSKNLTPLSLSGFSTCAVIEVPIGFPGSSCHAR